MTFKKFESKDILYNVLETNPKQKIQIYDSEMYLNDEPRTSLEKTVYSYRQNFETTAIGSLPSGWTTYGDLDWQVTGSEYYEGDRSAGSNPDLVDSQATSLVYTASVDTPETLTFWWKVSSETNFDFLRFYIDEIQQDEVSGPSVPWEQKTYSLPAGTSNLRWEYSKDGSVTAGDDAAWVDDVRIFKTVPVSPPGVPTGFVSLFELNVGRSEETTGLIYPFVTKDGSLIGTKTISTTTFNSDFSYGDTITGSYPLSSSIKRDFYQLGASRPEVDALKNTLNYYVPLSRHYSFSSSLGNKETQEVNLISIPSIMYGSSINKGSVKLDFYISGTLFGTLEDVNGNGELIQTGPVGSVGSGSVAGVVLYNEGFLLLTGSWDLDATPRNYIADPTNLKEPSWLYFGVGANDGIVAGTIPSSSYDLHFEGVSKVPTITMLAHADKGEVNNSNNPTFIEFGQTNAILTSSAIYQENKELTIKNIASSSYGDYSESFSKITYISKIGIYDENKNLIGISTVATPVKKEENQNFTFKIKLDI